MRTGSIIALLLFVTFSAMPCRAEVFFNPQNGHYYEFVAASEISWKEAKTQAESRCIYVPCTGQTLRGYLATVTSQCEQDFLYKHFQQHELVWLGASDGDNDKLGPNEWRWVSGPENGQLFWKGNNSDGMAYGFHFWMRNENGSLVEPNDSNTLNPGESYLNWNHKNPSNLSKKGFWNDLKNDTPDDVVSGLFVEYGACCAPSRCIEKHRLRCRR